MSPFCARFVCLSRLCLRAFRVCLLTRFSNSREAGAADPREADNNAGEMAKQWQENADYSLPLHPWLRIGSPVLVSSRGIASCFGADTHSHADCAFSHSSAAVVTRGREALNARCICNRQSDRQGHVCRCCCELPLALQCCSCPDFLRKR